MSFNDRRRIRLNNPVDARTGKILSKPGKFFRSTSRNGSEWTTSPMALSLMTKILEGMFRY